MALTTTEQKYFDFARQALPPWMPDDDEFLMGCAKMFGLVHTLIVYMFGQAKISTATGPTYDGGGKMLTPDWLNQHARDRGTGRQNGEDDPTLRARLREVPEALSRESLIAAANSILAASGLPQTAAIVELPRDAAHTGSFVSNSGTGGTFAVGAGFTSVFTPTTAFARPPYRDPSVVRLVQNFELELNATAGANDGAFAVTAISTNGAQFENPNTSIAGADPSATWAVRKLSRRPIYTLTKNGGGGAWNGGGNSFETIAGNGFAEFVVDATAKYCAAGLSAGNTATVDWNTIDYGVYLKGGGTPTEYAVIENGTERVTGVYAVNDVFRVQRTGTAVTYYKNGSLVWTSTVPSTGALRLDVALFDNPSTLSSIHLVDGTRWVPLTWQNLANATLTRGTLDGKSRAYCSRGFRVAGSRPTMVIMLPYGATTGIVASVREMLRQKKAAGFRTLVERRLNP